MSQPFTRRQLLATGGAFVAAAAVRRPEAACGARAASGGWTLLLRTRAGSLDARIRAASAAGFDGIEVWASETADAPERLARGLKDAGLSAECVAGTWEDASRQMDVAARLGARRLVLAPVDLRAGADVRQAGARYRELLEVAEATGVTPILHASTCGSAVAAALEAGSPGACVACDASQVPSVLRFLSPACLALVRVGPAEGGPALPPLLRDLRAAGFRGPLALDLAQEDLGPDELLRAARAGIAKLCAAMVLRRE